MIICKAGVRVKGIKPEMAFALPIIEAVYREAGYDCVITSGDDGTHTTIVHPLGFALDFRTKHIDTDTVKQEVRDKCAMYLTDEFDVILEYLGEDREHLHVEFDPR